jgi:hypothetical protein
LIEEEEKKSDQQKLITARMSHTGRENVARIEKKPRRDAKKYANIPVSTERTSIQMERLEVPFMRPWGRRWSKNFIGLWWIVERGTSV